MSASASELTANRPAGAPWPIPDAAAYLSVSARHLWRLIDAGEVKAVRLGRRVLIPADELNRIATQGCGTPE
jgi:excisionase family DNA binding protein